MLCECYVHLTVGPEAVIPSESAAGPSMYDDHSTSNDVEKSGHSTPSPVSLSEAPVFIDKPPMSPASTRIGLKRKIKQIRKKKMVTHEDVLEEQYKTLIAKQENIALKKRKLQLQVYLLEQRVREHSPNPLFTTINLSPIMSVNPL